MAGFICVLLFLLMGAYVINDESTHKPFYAQDKDLTPWNRYVLARIVTIDLNDVFRQCKRLLANAQPMTCVIQIGNAQ